MDGSGLDVAREALERVLVAVREGGDSADVVA
jgi:hypothetical protein